MKTYLFKKLQLIISAMVLLLVFIIIMLYEVKSMEHIRFVRNMGNGINLGNSLDATNLWDYIPDADELDYETFWGNPKITQSQLNAVYKAGFRTVRIPVTFEDHIDENNHISDVWMDRVEEIIKLALNENLYVIMDLHGDEWLNLDVTNKTEIMEKFKTVWFQIAQRFGDYDNHLLFEGMNEPRLRDTEHEWSDGNDQLRKFINELNMLFVDTVRSTGKKNSERYLLICPYCNGPWVDTLSDLYIPKGNIIVAVHMYRPYDFCQNESGTAQWNPYSEDDIAEARDAFELMNKTCVKKKIPVIFTEYGCKDKDNTEERSEWAKYYMMLSNKYHIPCIWWDNGSTYQLLDRNTLEWKFPEIVQIITNKK